VPEGRIGADREPTVSAHYEVVFSVFLRDDTPADVLAELRWHLGLSPERPPRLAIDRELPLLAPGSPSRLPGGEGASLDRRHRYPSSAVEHYAWSLYARLYWLDDLWAHYWGRVAELLAPWADEDGYAGFFREEFDQTRTFLLFRDGAFHLGESGRPDDG
jgi:hypothetical protein